MNLSLRILSAALASMFVVGAAHADDAKILAAVKTIKETATIRSVRDVPGFPGLKEVVADNTVVFMDPNGRFLFFGTLLDLDKKINLSEEAGSIARRATLAAIPDSDKIIYKPKGEVKHRVVVFTDVSCGYCHKLHESMQDYLDKGIQVEYVAYPRGGQQNPAFAQMQKIWCSKDRAAAMDLVSGGKKIEGVAACNDPVAKGFEIGESLAFEGTPAIYDFSGKQYGGFVPPAELATRLEKEGGKTVEKIAAIK